jgi:hypothetical protein
MSAMRRFRVTLYPAYSEGGMIRTAFGQITALNNPSAHPNREIAASTMEELLALVGRYAAEHKKGCQAIVRPLDTTTRKWPRFDVRVSGLYYNVASVPLPAPAPVEARV